MYNFIVNPVTGRKVSINNKLGKKILQKYIRLIAGFSLNPGSTRQGAISGGAGPSSKYAKKEIAIDNTDKREKLLSEIPLAVWHNIIASTDYDDVKKILCTLREVNRFFKELLPLEECNKIVLEARRRHLLQLVADQEAIMLDNNRIILNVPLHQRKWIDGETVVEFSEKEVLQKHLEDTKNFTEEEINRAEENSKFLLIDKHPSRRSDLAITIQLIEPIVREGGAVENIVLERVDTCHLDIVGKLILLKRPGHSQKGRELKNGSKLRRSAETR